LVGRESRMRCQVGPARSADIRLLLLDLQPRRRTQRTRPRRRTGGSPGSRSGGVFDCTGSGAVGASVTYRNKYPTNVSVQTGRCTPKPVADSFGLGAGRRHGGRAAMVTSRTVGTRATQPGPTSSHALFSAPTSGVSARVADSAQSIVTTVQPVTYSAGPDAAGPVMPVTLQLMLTVRPRTGATSSGVAFEPALPLPVALVSTVVIGMGIVSPEQSRLSGWSIRVAGR
jgi:hypothetical protein